MQIIKEYTGSMEKNRGTSPLDIELDELQSSDVPTANKVVTAFKIGDSRGKDGI